MTDLPETPSLREVVDLVRHGFPTLAEDVVNNRRAFWIGSGISKFQVPDLAALLGSVFSYLAVRAVSGDPDARSHSDTLRRLLSTYLPAELTLFDESPQEWTVPADLEGLANSYSEILDSEVDGFSGDHLLWDGADVREMFGSPEIEPGVNHYLLAILIHEGVLTQLASANWDGLIEKAVAAIDPVPTRLKLASYVTNDDFRDLRADARLLKLHGCAVKARNTETPYREYIAASPGDLASVLVLPIHREMADEIKKLAQRERPLFLGLSVQDADLLTIFTLAGVQSPWAWSADHPAYLFAEKELKQPHKTLLKQVYGQAYSDQRPAIQAGSRFPAFATPLLAALVIEVISRKLCALISLSTLEHSLFPQLVQGIADFADHLASLVGTELETLPERLISGLSAMVQTFYGTLKSADGRTYLPLTSGSLEQIMVDPRTKALGSPSFAVVIGLLGMGQSRGDWELDFDLGAVERTGSIELKRHDSMSPTYLFLVGGEAAADAFVASSYWQNSADNLALVHTANARPTQFQRGPAGGLGKDRAPGSRRRETWMASLPSAGSDLFEAFRSEVSA
jgi:hypothetical protein